MFNCIETYFFITLGIAFILIMLLVIHFKKQLSDIEQTEEKMFVIFNNLVDEIKHIKQMNNTTKDVKTIDIFENQNYKNTLEEEVEEETVEYDSDDSDDSYNSESDDENIKFKILVSDDDDKYNDTEIKIIDLDLDLVIELKEEQKDEVIELKDEVIKDEVEELEEEVEDVEEDLKKNDEDYKKLSIQALKSLVISKGLSIDPSKLKKNEILKLFDLK